MISTKAAWIPSCHVFQRGNQEHTAILLEGQSSGAVGIDRVDALITLVGWVISDQI